MSNFTLTNKGTELLARVLAGEGPLKFTKLKLGSGNFTGNVKEALDLVSSFGEWDIIGYGKQADNLTVRLDSVVNNNNLNSQQELKEKGIFAQLGNDSTTEILYSYVSQPNYEFIIPDKNTPWAKTFKVLAQVNDSTNITVNITTKKDKYDFNTTGELKAASYLVLGDKVKMWGKNALGDIENYERIVYSSNDGTGELLPNNNYANVSGVFKTSHSSINNVSGLLNITNRKVIVINSELICNSNITLSNFDEIIFEEGGKINVSDGFQIIIDCKITANDTLNIFGVTGDFKTTPEKKAPVKFKYKQDAHVLWFGGKVYDEYSEMVSGYIESGDAIEHCWRALVGDYTDKGSAGYWSMEYTHTGSLILPIGKLGTQSSIILGRRPTNGALYLWGSCNIIGQGEGQSYLVSTNPNNVDPPLIINGKALEYTTIKDFKVTYANYTVSGEPIYTSSKSIAGILIAYAGSLRLEGMWNSAFSKGAQMMFYSSDNVSVQSIQTEYNDFDYQFVNSNDISINTVKGFLPEGSTIKFGCSQAIRAQIQNLTGLPYTVRKNVINIDDLVVRGQSNTVNFIDIEDQEAVINLNNAIINHSYGNPGEVKLSSDFIKSTGTCKLTLNASNVDISNFQYISRETNNFSGGRLNFTNVIHENTINSFVSGDYGFITGILEVDLINCSFKNSNARPFVLFSTKASLKNVNFENVKLSNEHFAYTSNGTLFCDNVTANCNRLGQINSASYINISRSPTLLNLPYDTQGAAPTIKVLQEVDY